MAGLGLATPASSDVIKKLKCDKRPQTCKISSRRMSKFDTTARFSPEEAHLSRAFCESGNTFYIKKKRIHFGEKTEKLGIYHYLVASPTYLPVLCTAEFLVEILSHGINQERVFHPAPGKHVPHQTDPPRPAIHALADAIVWVCA